MDRLMTRAAISPKSISRVRAVGLHIYCIEEAYIFSKSVEFIARMCRSFARSFSITRIASFQQYSVGKIEW